MSMDKILNSESVEEKSLEGDLHQSQKDLDDLIKKLNFFKNLPKREQKRFFRANLDLTKALKRCENIHGKGNCVKLWGTMTVKKYPQNFSRIGCCMCRQPCLVEHGFKNAGECCQKLPAYNTSIYDDSKSCSENIGKLNCEEFRGEFWTKECQEPYVRLGKTRCVHECPGNWVDIGDRCKPKKMMNVG